jgi:hypothetical protein
MEQLQQLIDLLSATPEMALWAAAIYFGFLLLKAASWITAATVVLKLFINRLFNWKENRIKEAMELSASALEAKKIESENGREQRRHETEMAGHAAVARKENALYDMLDETTYKADKSLQKLLLAIGDGSRVHSHELDRVTKLVLESKPQRETK